MIHRINWGTGHPNRGSFTPDGRHAVWGGTTGSSGCIGCRPPTSTRPSTLRAGPGQAVTMKNRARMTWPSQSSVRTGGVHPRNNG